MCGYYLTYHSLPNAKNVPSDTNSECTQITLDGWMIHRHTLPKFPNHKFFLDESSFFFSTDGVILNRDELLNQYHCSDFAALISNLYHQYGETFFRYFRGSFSGVFYDKEKQLMLIFVDHAGTRLLFWEQEKETIRISSDLGWLVGQTRTQRDSLGLYELLTYGYMPSHHTIAEGIHRLPAGNCLRITSSSCEQIQYHRFSNDSIHRTQKEEIQGVDKLFRQAVQRVLKVNAEYGYRNIFPLSAGLDSRMATWVAHSQTTTPIENFTHGFDSDQDVIVAHSIADSLSHKWYFHSQESADFYANIDQSVCHSGAQICYAGIAEATDISRSIPSDEVGMILTGIGGDDILTSPLSRSWKHYHYGECALSTISYPEQKAFIPKDFASRYATRNIFYLYARTFECHAMGSPLAFQQFTESYSPFMDIDFLEFVFSIPENHRKNYRLYDQWILECFPEAAQWKHNGKTIGNRAPELYIFHRHLPFRTITKRLVAFILRKLHICELTNAELRNAYAPNAESIWQHYFDTNKHYLRHYGQIAERVEKQFRSENYQEKVQALTVLAAIKMIEEAHLDGHPRS